MVDIPKYHEFFKPTLEVMVDLGGSGSIEEIDEALITKLALTQAQLDLTYPKSGAPIAPDRMSWARSWLKDGGFLENPQRGVWVLTEAGRAAAAGKSPAEIRKLVNAGYNLRVAARKAAASDGDDVEEGGPEGAAGWADLLLQRIQAIEPAAFERLCQRLLRESGFTRVEVTGKSSDGGIDGVGVLRMNLVSFHVLFQCKRWKNSVGSEVVRNFRGAMQGRADKGLVITTGTFTAEARREATRDGAPAIDLIDGETLCELLKERGLGVTVREVRTEVVVVDEGFFEGI
jgi:restriction system protein